MGRGKLGILPTIGACAALALSTVAANAADFGGSIKDEAPVEEGRKLELSGGAYIASDYIFRGLSFSSENPTVGAYFNATYGIFYIGAWGIGSDFTAYDDPTDFTVTDTVAIEIDYYAGIAPSWNGYNFDLSVLYYTFPGAKDRAAETNYWEIHFGVKKEVVKNLTLGADVNWSPDNTFESGQSWHFQGTADLTLPKVGRFSPGISGGIGHVTFEDDAVLNTGLTSSAGFALPDYTYWHVGLYIGFHENWSLDLRYWDTDIDNTPNASFGGLTNCEQIAGGGGDDHCNSRFVATLTATF